MNSSVVARPCWSVLASKAEEKISSLQVEMAQARQRLESLDSSRQRVQAMYDDYRLKLNDPQGASQGMREAFRVRRELGLPFRRIAPQSQDASKPRIVIFRNDISQFRPTVANAGQVGDERKARLHELGAVFEDGRAVGATGAIGKGSKVDAQRLQRPRGVQHRRSFLRLLRREELHGNRRTAGGP